MSVVAVSMSLEEASASANLVRILREMFFFQQLFCPVSYLGKYGSLSR